MSLVRQQRTPWEVVSVIPVPSEWDARCDQGCQVDKVEVWETMLESEFIGSHSAISPSRRAVPLPCRHEGPVRLRRVSPSYQ